MPQRIGGRDAAAGVRVNGRSGLPPPCQLLASCYARVGAREVVGVAK